MDITVNVEDCLSDSANKPQKEKDDYDNEDFSSTEKLRESPVQWPENLPSTSDTTGFQTRTDTPIQVQNVESGQDLTAEEREEVNKLAVLSPEELAAKIRELFDQVYQVGVREAEEMKRGRELGIFSRKGREE